MYVTVVTNCSRAEFMPIIEARIIEGSTIDTDGWKAYDRLILNGYDHYRIYYSHNKFTRGKSHINRLNIFGVSQ